MEGDIKSTDVLLALGEYVLHYRLTQEKLDLG
jgi:hypothetical protein